MIPEAALAIAGPHARLVARPAGVAHVYTGRLTPSGRFVPTTARPVCRARTRRLAVLPLPERCTSLDCTPATRRMCARCTARLDRDRDRSRRATTDPRNRDQWAAVYAGTTKADVAFALELATTPAEVDAAAWLSLLLFDVAGCAVPFTEHGRQYRSLHRLVYAARGRVDGYPESVRAEAERAAARSAAAKEQRISEAKAARAEREDRIRRLGMNNAFPQPTRRAPRRT